MVAHNGRSVWGAKLLISWLRRKREREEDPGVPQILLRA
jgi:hypothetical protein